MLIQRRTYLLVSHLPLLGRGKLTPAWHGFKKIKFVLGHMAYLRAVNHAINRDSRLKPTAGLTGLIALQVSSRLAGIVC